MPVKPGLRPLLAFLRKNGYGMTVATSTDEEKTRYNLAKAGVEGYFAKIVCGDMVARGKPEPDIYLKACEVLGLAPAACMALEDSPAGILAAYRAGMRPVMVPDTVQPDAATEKLLYAKLPALDGVIGLLEQKK